MKQNGFTIVEVLLALLIVSVGFVVFAGIIGRSMQVSAQSVRLSERVSADEEKNFRIHVTEQTDPGVE